ncbi:M48 family metallopeptidase [Undibacterium terreum]|uniref:Metalloprotease n=1 Tax=Undibacterium terreum TaxID=1224302 RepID=A0A916UF16_9BURK|nr:M48 family metallopeptidase [Undibacterium terreum]GGC70312.1 metalloprotease [Undibacterium terreum]
MSKKLFWLLPIACLLLAAIIAAVAPLSENAQSRAAAEIAPVTDAWRAALPHDPVAATQAYMSRISPAAKARSDAYFEGGYWLQAISFAISLASYWAILSSRVLVRLRERMEKRNRRRWLISLLSFASFIILCAAFNSPLDFYQGYYREHLYGLANQGFSSWFIDFFIALAINSIGLSLVLLAVYAVIRKLPKTWWIWGAAIGIGFLCLLMLISPTYIDPLFNTYKPLADEKVKQPILSMARSNGVPADNVYQFDASKQSNRVSANVSGIFGTAAVRLNDNLLNRSSLPEIKAVMGHELGHYVLNHVYHFIFSFGLILLLGFVFVQHGMAYSLKRWGNRLGIRDQADPASLPLFFALFATYLFVMTPVLNTVIRNAETEADIFGVNTSQEPDGFAEAHLKLTEYRKSDPGPVEEFLFYDHPSPRKRIYTAMRWKAEHLQPELKPQ